jgi:hypothetical protein
MTLVTCVLPFSPDIVNLLPVVLVQSFKQLQWVVIEFETRVQVFVHSENFAPEPGKACHILA